MDLPQMGLDAVRAGISVYGIYPSDEVNREMPLYPAMEIRSFVTCVKDIEPGNKRKLRRDLHRKTEDANCHH